MTSRQAFKVAFLMRCADEGLTSEQILGRVKTALALMEKKAWNPLANWGFLGGAAAGSGGGPASAATGGAFGHAVQQDPIGMARGAFVLPLALAAGAGGLGGMALAKMKQDPLVIEEAKADEEIGELTRLADRARRAKQLNAEQNRM